MNYPRRSFLPMSCEGMGARERGRMQSRQAWGRADGFAFVEAHFTKKIGPPITAALSLQGAPPTARTVQ